MILDDLDTPSVVVDLDRMERNIARMAAIARVAGVALRPHAKTHKIPRIGHRQLAAGSVGLTVAKLGEAEVFVDGGITDLFIAYPLWGEAKWERLCRLAARADLRVTADSYEVLEGISRTARRHGLCLPVRLEVDSGFGRCGLQSPAEVHALARRMAALRGVRLVGLMGFGGHSYGEGDAEGIRRVGHEEGRQLVDLAARLRADGFDIAEVSAGSTPTAPHVAGVAGITEIRPGTYVFSDRDQVALGWGEWEDCALTLLVTVISRPTATRAIVDGGTKTFSSDGSVAGTGWGAVRGHPEYALAWLTEEHGILKVPASAYLPIGTRLQVIPNHACGALNMHDLVVAARGEQVEEVWPVAARGRVQ